MISLQMISKLWCPIRVDQITEVLDTESRMTMTMSWKMGTEEFVQWLESFRWTRWKNSENLLPNNAHTLNAIEGVLKIVKKVKSMLVFL